VPVEPMGDLIRQNLVGDSAFVDPFGTSKKNCGEKDLFYRRIGAVKWQWV